jgi:hypothetical protein
MLTFRLNHISYFSVRRLRMDTRVGERRRSSNGYARV